MKMVDGGLAICVGIVEKVAFEVIKIPCEGDLFVMPEKGSIHRIILGRPWFEVMRVKQDWALGTITL